MRNPVTIPLTKDKTRNLIIDLETVNNIEDTVDGCLINYSTNGMYLSSFSELSASDLYEEICSPSK